MSRPFYVGVCGKARSGKDTFANVLSHECYQFPGINEVAVVSLATPIKRMVDALLQYADLGYLVGGKEDEVPGLGASPRVLYQTLGTEWGRNLIGEDLWLNVLISALGRHRPEADVVIIPDIRFDNEAEVMDVLFQINRKDCEQVAAHESEAGINPELVTHHIRNNDNVQALHKKARAAATRIFEAYNEFKKDET